MPQGLPFSVDTWTPSSKQKRHHFLTHAHRDHTTGIAAHSSFPIYSTFLTKSIVLQQFPQVSLHYQSIFYIFSFSRRLNLTWCCCSFVFFSQLHDSLFVCIEVGQALVVKDPDGAFTVTVFDAHHCPGNLPIRPICSI